MPISSSLPTTRRGYLSQSELSQYADITITDTAEADDRIGQAEEQIDAYCGYIEKYMPHVVTGQCSAASSSSLTLEQSHQNTYDKNYFKNCEIEIVSGTGEGQRRRVLSSLKTGVLTVSDSWSTTPDTTSIYRIYQLAKFPRPLDVEPITVSGETVIVKTIPEAVKRAVAAQVAFAIQKGDSFFQGDSVEKISEKIGDYSYEKSSTGSGGFTKLVSPMAKMLLKGYVSKIGKLIG